MIIVLRPEVTEEEIQHIVDKIETYGLKVHISRGQERTIIGAIGDETKLREKPLDAISGVEKVMPVVEPYKLASRSFHPENSIISIDGGKVKVGGDTIAVIAGPCTVETEEQTIKTAIEVKKSGANLLRGGAFKPRTSPYSFQGLGKDGLEILVAAKKETGLPIVTEVMDPRDVELVAEYSDVIQIGARNVQNFTLLKEVGKYKKPILLKRGMMSTIEELLMSAEYIMSEGNLSVMLCERGIRTFETSTRNTLDLSMIPVTRKLTHLPNVIDPSHAAGKRDYVEPLTLASIACGCDALLIEVHHCPEEAMVDGAQSLTPVAFTDLMKKANAVAKAVGKKLGTLK
jgi:3-deoxy-7-phosphoheptulonate synthase